MFFGLCGKYWTQGWLNYSRTSQGVTIVLWLCLAAGAIGEAVSPLPADTSVGDAKHLEPAFTLPLHPSVDDFWRIHAFQEPLVPIGGAPSAVENADLAVALVGYAHRAAPDDFASLTGFLDQHPDSPWAAALLTDLGLEYYNTAHYSLALDAWQKAWNLGQNASDAKGVAIADRAIAELALMYARLGRMTELEALLKSVQGRPFIGPALGKIAGARDGLWTMQNRPGVAFRCGPLALHCIAKVVSPDKADAQELLKAASTQQGFSLTQVAALSQKIGLNYQMAFRQANGDFAVPAVVHWKVGHYAAIIRKQGNRYLIEDPTFRNSVWATKAALESETSGYFLIGPGSLPAGWRAVAEKEGDAIWGKGVTYENDPGPITPRDLKKGPPMCGGMMQPYVHLMTANLNLVDAPLGYQPPVGPAAPFTVRYNSQDVFQPGNFNYGNLGSKWTSDWITYITDNPQSPLADITYYIGGGQRTFTGFNTNTQSFNYQQYDQTLLTRTATNPISYQMVWPDGSKFIFSQSDGSIGTSRNIFLSQMIDAQGNALTLTYGANLLLTAITDAIGQVTSFTYGVPANDALGLAADPYKLTQVTDPFGRAAVINYEPVLVAETFTYVNGMLVNTTPIYTWDLASVTDVIGMTSQVSYGQQVISKTPSAEYFDDYVTSLTTPYGTTTFTEGGTNTTRYVETLYPDGSRDRVEFNQTVNIPDTDPTASVPQGMTTFNGFLSSRDTYYWDQNACAMAYGDYTKAAIYHWLHAEDINTCSGMLESTRKALEGRVWYDYQGQPAGFQVGPSNRPQHAGRVLDDGSTQLYTFAHNEFGHLTNSVDPVGRNFSFIYSTNGIDLLEIRQTRGTNNELIAKSVYNSQHEPISIVDASGQTNIFTYNARGQMLTAADPQGETITRSYDPNGYLVAVRGPLPGPNDAATLTYDAVGRIRTITDVSGYILTYDYDNLDRKTRATYPDGTFDQFTYDRLDLASVLDRAGRQTSLQHNSLRQLVEVIDPLNRTNLFDWCRCGSVRSLTDPMGRPTSWVSDVAGRIIAKQYGDGSQVKYIYEGTTSRLLEAIDEKLQTTTFAYNLDDTLKSRSYGNTLVQTTNINFAYDPKYLRITSMTDALGTTCYRYNPIGSLPSLGANELAAQTGPSPGENIAYSYDQLGRPVQTVVDGAALSVNYDPAGRVSSMSNVLGSFAYTYDGCSDRLVSETYPNGLTMALSYGSNLQDFKIQQIVNTIHGIPLSQFNYGWDVARNRITTWSQQIGAEPPDVHSLGYDDDGQLLSDLVTNSGSQINEYGYSYDPAGNRLSEQVGASLNTVAYNALNQMSAGAASSAPGTNEWDAMQRLTAVSTADQRTEFAYDGRSHLASVRQLQSGTETAFRRFVWRQGRISEERDESNNITKYFFPQGVSFQTGSNAGAYYYTADQIGSIRELTDGAGAVRARYTYDPWGRRSKVAGDLDADMGFAGMFWSPEAQLSVTLHRAYDPQLGRWLSRDPLAKAELLQGPNLYAYAANDPINLVDPAGLSVTPWTPEWLAVQQATKNPYQYEIILASYERRQVNPIWKEDPTAVANNSAANDAAVEYAGNGELQEVGGGELQEAVGGELQEVEGEIVEVTGGEIVEVTGDEAIETLASRLPEIPGGISSLKGIGFAGVFNDITGIGLTILTMTDCNVANGIFALARVGKGGLLNVYEDQMMKQLDQFP